MLRKNNKSAFNGCPNTVISNRLEGKVITLTFSCPRVSRLLARGLSPDTIQNANYARQTILATMGNMCINCALSEVPYSHKTEASVSPTGALIESVVWAPVSISEKPTFEQDLSIEN